MRDTNTDATFLCVLITVSFLYFFDRNVQKYLKIYKCSKVRYRKGIFRKLNSLISGGNKRPYVLKQFYILKVPCLFNYI